MKNTKEFRMVHRIMVQEEADKVFGFITDVEKWPDIFTPCQKASILKEDGKKVLIEITAFVNGELRTWQSERIVDRETREIEFVQANPFPPMTGMTGYWVVEEDKIFGSCVYLIHDFGIKADENWTLENAEEWVKKACDKNSISELNDLKNVIEQPQRRGDVPVLLNFPSIRYDELLRKSAENYPDKTALIHSDKLMTFREVEEKTNAIAFMLSREYNIKQGDVVALTATPCPEAIITFQAIARMGAVVTPINPLYGPREIENLLKDSGAIAGVFSHNMFTKTEEITGRIPQLKHIIRFNDGSPNNGEGMLKDAEKFPVTPFPSPVVNPDDLLALPYSSGTSGMPKGVMLTHSNLTSNAIQFMSAHRVTNFDVMLNGLPVLLSMHMGAGLASGATQILVDRWDVNWMLDLAEEYKATQLYTVTPFIVEMSKLEDLEKRELPALQFISSGASSLNLKIAETVSKRLNIAVVQGFGLTEASPLTHATPVIKNFSPPAGTCGMPVPGTKQRIIDIVTGREMEPGETGLLAIHGPQVMKAYWNGEEETKKALKDGWLFTGDLAKVDSKGFLYYVDRSKDVIKVLGHSVPPVELEMVVKGHPDVLDCAVIGLDVSFDEQHPYAFIVMREESGTSTEDIVNYANGLLAEYKHIKGSEVIDKIPRSGSGKLLRRVLRDKLNSNK